ncbi:MAG: DUF4377 domain-containing protein [Bacteroidota bacterium]
MNKLILYPLSFLFTFFVSCSSDDASESGLINLRVNYFTMECEGLFPTQCLQVQEGNDIGTTTWYNFFDSIENFAYEPGFIYDLQVEKTEIENPPADASAFQYRLVRILSKTEVTCSFEDPTADLEWLRIEIERREANRNEQTKYCYISQAEYQDSPVFLYFDCNPAINKVIPVFDCLGKSIGFLGDGEIDQNSLTNFKIIWQPDDFACLVTLE